MRQIELKPYSQRLEHISFNLSETELAVAKSGLDQNHRTKPGHQVRLETEVVCDTGIGRITRIDGYDYNGEISRG